jgi:DNA-binding FrmR family transcriptional regulator
MRDDAKKKTLAAIKRLEGLTAKLRNDVENDAYCTKILELQAAVLESHLHTCAAKKLASPADKAAFIEEVINVVGLSKR